ncbi:MAG TPA: hypothetical protein VKG22_01280, partial [Stellaceae bacterium]|nr:hypothetical protein [Stellaceae bacterium]
LSHRGSSPTSLKYQKISSRLCAQIGFLRELPGETGYRRRQPVGRPDVPGPLGDDCGRITAPENCGPKVPLPIR